MKVATAEKQTIAQEFTAIGTVAPAEQSTVAASISAQIKQMRLLKNQFVKQGEVLAVLASQDLQSQRNEAKAALDEAKLNLETLQKVTIPQTRAQTEKDLSDAKANADNARATYERRKDLYEKGGLSLKELEASKLALQNAENALRLAQANSKLNTSAVTLDASNSDEGTVMTVDDASVAHETKVKVGIKQGDKIQIIEGLEGGETVVTEGNYSLPDGTKVEVAKEEENKDEEK